MKEVTENLEIILEEEALISNLDRKSTNEIRLDVVRQYNSFSSHNRLSGEIVMGNAQLLEQYEVPEI